MEEDFDPSKSILSQCKYIIKYLKPNNDFNERCKYDGGFAYKCWRKNQCEDNLYYACLEIEKFKNVIKK